FANPSSVNHRAGREAFEAIEQARRRVAQSIGAQRSSEITFLSGATEANNLALKGVTEAATSRRHIVTQSTEHSSILAPLRELERRGFKLTVVSVAPDGLVDLDELAQALRDDTLLVSIMAANSETGVIQPVAEISRMAHEADALMHCDAAQAIGKIDVSVKDLGIDLLSLSAHKFYGPKGAGALYIRRRRPPISPVPGLHGGGQESGMRAGTANVPAIVGMASAIGIALDMLEGEPRRQRQLRDHLELSITTELPGCRINGEDAPRLPNTTNITFEGVEGNALQAALVELAASSGSACSSSNAEPSHVLRAMGVPADLAQASLRFSLGRSTTAEEVKSASDMVIAEIERLRKL
ncbi:MAG: cysteine desulfurase, partial [bacterium]|nr:cysteine desulfurase [bacterium]